MVKEGYIDYLGYKTYYRIVNPDGHKTPLVLLHGGPGSTHNSHEIFDPLAYDDDRPLVMYDQIGCGKSSVEGSHKELWHQETWANELINLREQLGLKEIHLLGHSWGGMLAIIYLCDCNPEGVKSVTLSSTLSSASLWRKETHRLIGLLDKRVQNVLLRAEAENNFDDPKVKKAVDYYYHKFVFGPWKKKEVPECLTRKKPSSKETYETSWGKSEFDPTGTLRNYEYTDKLKTIKCPVMLCSGVNDESTPLQNKIMYENITSPKKWHLYPNSRHMTYYEDNESYMKNLKEFLNENE